MSLHPESPLVGYRLALKDLTWMGMYDSERSSLLFSKKKFMSLVPPAAVAGSASSGLASRRPGVNVIKLFTSVIYECPS